MIRAVTTSLAVLTVALAGCSEPDTSAEEQPELPSKAPSATTTSKTPDEPKTNERGHLVKKLGQKAGLGEGKGSVTFAIDRVTVDPPCEEYGEKPTSGHTLVLDIRVATGNDPDIASAVSFLLDISNFAELSRDGVTRPAEDGYCATTDDGLPETYGVNQKYRGQIELVVPEANGTLILANEMSNAGGWEWRYPAR